MKGIVKIPDWAKQAFNNGPVESIKLHYGGQVGVGIIHLDGIEFDVVLSSSSEFVINDDDIGSITIPRDWIEIIPEPVDWNRVKVDAPIEVLCDNKWIEYHFHSFSDHKIYYFPAGKTSHTCEFRNFAAAGIEDVRLLNSANPQDHYKD